MILALLLLAQAAPATPPVGTTDDIVVIGERLKKWRAGVTFRDGKARCQIKTSSGDADIDRIGCTAMIDCWPATLPQFEATRDKALAADARKAMLAKANKELGTCVMARRKTLVAELVERRRAAKGGA